MLKQQGFHKYQTPIWFGSSLSLMQQIARSGFATFRPRAVMSSRMLSFLITHVFFGSGAQVENFDRRLLALLDC